MAIGVGDILRIALQWFADGSDEIVNVHTFRVDDLGTTTGDGDFMTELALLLASDLYDGIVTTMADNIVGSLMTGLNLTENQVLPPVSQSIDGVVSAQDAYARQVTALVYLNTNVPRRQGRSYLPPFDESAVTDNGEWDSTVVALLADYGLKLLDPIDDGGIVVRRVVCHQDGTSSLVPSFAGVSLAPRTQRRRTPGFGS